MKNEEIVIEDGTVSWFYGEQVPAGFYWVVLDVIATIERKPPLDGKWFAAQWQGAILTAGSVVKKSSPKFAPQVGASFVQQENPRAYKLKLKCFYSFEEAEKFAESCQADAGWEANYDWSWMDTTKLFHVNFIQEKKKQDDIEYTFSYRGGGKSFFNNVWFDESTPDDSYQQEQTEQQRIAQRQVDLNKAKISKLEKELKDLRELQKLLKGMR